MNITNLKRPLIIFAIGLVVIIAAYLLTSIVLVPTVTTHDFQFSVTYRHNGEVKTLENVYRCTFSHSEGSLDPLGRWYSVELLDRGMDQHAYGYTFAEENGYDLVIVTYINGCYLMNDTKNESYDETVEDPYIAVYDIEGVEYTDLETLSQFDVEILSWDYPEPIENDFVFFGFSALYEDNMLAMLAAAILVLIACAIFVKKDPEVLYTSLDKISFACNLVVGIIGIPTLAFLSTLVLAYQTGPDWIYQAYLCTPVITALTIAASIALRRRECSKSGFVVQFIGPVLTVAIAIAEYLI